MKKDILVLHGVGAHEVLEGWEDEFVQRTFESTLTTLSRLQQEKDGGLGKQVQQDHSKTSSKETMQVNNISTTLQAFTC